MGYTKKSHNSTHIFLVIVVWISVRSISTVSADILARPSVGAASTKAAVTVGANAPLTSGKEIELISASWNVCEVRNVIENYFYL